MRSILLRTASPLAVVAGMLVLNAVAASAATPGMVCDSYCSPPPNIWQIICSLLNVSIYWGLPIPPP